MEMESKGTEADLITLRPFDRSDGDLDAFFAWASDDRVTHFCSYDTFASKADLREYIAAKVIPHPWFRAICLGNHPIGAIHATPAGGNDRHRVELGYAVAREHWGMGIATTAVRKAVLEVAEEMAGVERVEAMAEVENVASQKVLEKAGFVREGVLRRYWMSKGRVRDMVMYSHIYMDKLQS